jgi:hypothetical protein
VPLFRIEEGVGKRLRIGQVEGACVDQSGLDVLKKQERGKRTYLKSTPSHLGVKYLSLGKIFAFVNRVSCENR